MKKGSFILYDTDLKGLDYLSDIQAGKLFKAIAKYRLEGTKQKQGNNPAVNILYHQIIEHIAINEEKYMAVCNRNSESAKKRWRRKEDVNDVNNMPSDASECECIQKDTKLCLYDNVNDIDNDNDNDTDTDTVTVTDACGAKRENEEKNYYDRKNNVPNLLRDNPSYDIDAFMRKSLENYRNAAKQSDQQ